METTALLLLSDDASHLGVLFPPTSPTDQPKHLRNVLLVQNCMQIYLLYPIRHSAMVENSQSWPFIHRVQAMATEWLDGCGPFLDLGSRAREVKSDPVI